MKRKLVIALLATTTVLGFGSGFAHLAFGHHGCWHDHHRDRRARFEARVADVCVEAAERVLRKAPAGPAADRANTL